MDCPLPVSPPATGTGMWAWPYGLTSRVLEAVLKPLPSPCIVAKAFAFCRSNPHRPRK